MAKGVIWSVEARADLRAIDRDTALRLLKYLYRFLKTDSGSWRLIYRRRDEDTVEVVRVLNRREAYR